MQHAADVGTLWSRPGPEPTVVIVDDYPALLDPLGVYLEAHNLTVVGYATDGAAAVSLIEQLRPSVAVIDLLLPDMSGLELISSARQHAPEVRTVVYTGVADTEVVHQAFAAGASGFLQKSAPLSDLVEAIRTVVGGRMYADARLASAMLLEDSTVSRLTHRELAVLRLLAEGKSNGEAAAQLHIAPDTVRAHLRKAMKKLGSRTRTEAVATALRRSVIH